MTRAEAYAEGFQTGRREAEADIRNHNGFALGDSSWTTQAGRAWALGEERGYRDTWARWDAGTLTAQMLELAPVNR